MAYEIGTSEGLHTLRRAREDFLSEHRVPGDLPAWLSAAWRRAAWRRTAFHGVDVARDHVPPVDVTLDTPLLRAAAPVLERLAGHLAGLRAAVVLSRRACGDRRHLGVTGGDAGAPGADRQPSRRRTCPSPRLGVNGISQVLASQAPQVVGGPEHLFDLYQETVCAAAPVRGPVGGRLTGAVALVCGLEAPVPIPRALAATAVDAIERELVHTLASPERGLLATFHEASRGGRAIAVLDGRTRLLSDEAAALLLPEDRAGRNVSGLAQLRASPRRGGASPTPAGRRTRCR